MSCDEHDVLDLDELTPRAILQGMLVVWDYDPRRWTQGALSRAHDGATLAGAHDPMASAWCAAGAAVRGSRWSKQTVPLFAEFERAMHGALTLWAGELQEILHERLGYVVAGEVLPVFLNDHPETTFDDVLLATKRALDATYEETRPSSQ